MQKKLQHAISIAILLVALRKSIRNRGPLVEVLVNCPRRCLLGGLQAEYELAREMVSQGHRILMDDYGLSHESEFFAVASELYFQMPETLAEYHPNVYVLLRDFYVTELHSFPER